MAAVIVSTAILTRDTADGKADFARSSTRSSGAPADVRFSVKADDALNFRILCDGKPVLIMLDGYRVRFRCNPSNNHWIGTRRTPVHLAWSPWSAPQVSDVRVSREMTKDGFRLSIRGVKPQIGDATFSTTLLARRDVTTGRISYGIVSDLNASPEKVRNALGKGRIEYLDPWLEGIFWPQRDGHDRELYQSFVFFNAADQTLMRAPKLHLFPSLPDGTYETLARPLTAGALAVIDKSEPGIRFLVADLSGSGSVGICWWTWDPHFYIDLDTASGNKLTYALRVEEISQKTGARMLSDAKPIPFQSDEDYQVPAFTRDGVNRFDDMLDTPSEWGWEQSSRACMIDRTIGFDDKVSVTIKGEPDTKSAWYTRALGYDYFDHARLNGGHAVTAMVRTAEASKGARMGVLCYNGGEAWLYEEPDPVAVWSKPVVGTSDWQKRTVRFDGTGFKRFKIVLEQDGGGQSWFDNVVLKADPSADDIGWHDGIVDWRNRDWSKPQKVPFRAFQCSRPQMHSDPERLVMAWKDCTATSPQFRLPKGQFRLTLEAEADGCSDDLPILKLTFGTSTATYPIAIDAVTPITTPVASDGETPVTFELQFTNDGPCTDGTAQRDKNIYIRRVVLERIE